VGFTGNGDDPGPGGGGERYETTISQSGIHKLIADSVTSYISTESTINSHFKGLVGRIQKDIFPLN